MKIWETHLDFMETPKDKEESNAFAVFMFIPTANAP
jgi:hypothetical protein